MRFSFRQSMALAAVLCGGFAALPADAKTFKWANSGDVSSMDPYAREMIKAATKLYVDDFAYIPLHQQAVVWAARKNVDLVQLADNSFPLRFVTLK